MEAPDAALMHLLFVDDEPDLLAGLRRLLRPHRHEWTMTFAEGSEAALAALDSTEFDVVVADMRMPGMDGAELLAVVRQRQPGAVRIVLSGHALESSTVRSLPVAHQFLSKPCEPERLQLVIRRSLDVRARLADPALLALLGGLVGLPSPSAAVMELQDALGATSVDPTRIARIVASDQAMTSKLLQVTNSAFYGLPRVLDDPLEAVRLLGAPVVGEIVISTELLAALRSRAPGADVAIDEVRAHSLARAEIAAALAQRAGRSVAAVRRVWTAAFLSDVGELLVASDPHLAEVCPAHACRAAGGALLAMWGLPHHLVETAVLSGEPPSMGAADGHTLTWLAEHLLAERPLDLEVGTALDAVGLSIDDLAAVTPMVTERIGAGGSAEVRR